MKKEGMGAVYSFRRPIEEYEYWKSKIGEWTEYDPEKEYKLSDEK